MNRKYTLVLGLLLAGFASRAQNKAGMAGLPGISNMHNGVATASRTTDAPSRLIYSVDLAYNGIAFLPEDSTTYSYSGGRGGDLEHDTKFDDSYEYAYVPATTSYTNGSHDICTYDANNNRLTDLRQTWQTASSSWQNSTQYLLTYDASNNNTQMARQQWNTATSAWVNDAKYMYSYDASNNLTTSIDQEWNAAASAWVNYAQETFTYTAANKQATGAEQLWDNTTSTWVNSNKSISTYDASNNRTLDILQNWNTATSNWDNYSQYADTYDGSNNMLTNTGQIWTSGAWANYSLTTYSSYIGHEPGQYVYQLWDAPTSTFANSTRNTFTYNSDDQATYQYTEDWNAGGFWESTSSDRAYRYGYEDYVSAVQNTPNAGGHIDVYPVPAGNNITLDIQWEVRQACTIQVIDMQGRVVKQAEAPAVQQYISTVSLAGLQPGNYLLKITGNNGSIRKQITVIR